ncbi:MAG: hypothetical protein MUF27_08415 [Acidobacteria bacterium]|nr:hypothetical protein [Acidobacteriota bacterium]
MAYGSPASRALYARAPAWLRSLGATWHSLRVERQRFGPGYGDALARLDRSQWLPTADLVEASRREAAAFLADAVRQADHFAALFPAGAPADPAAAPILAKSDLRRNLPGFYARDAATHGATTLRHTSGTTGTPLELLTLVSAVERENAFAWQHRSWHGCPRGVRTATLAGHPVAPAEQDRPPFWVRNYAENQLIFSSYHMAPRHLPAYAKALARFDPELIHGYPSSVALVASAALEAGLRIRPRAVITASETLLPHQREVIAAAFGVPPRVWYGNTELAGNIVECPEGRLHVREEHSWLEFLDDAGGAAAAGQPARLIATAFGNRAMFLVRYDTADLAVPSAEAACPCGRGGRLVERVVGRVEDFVIDAAGRLVGRLDHLFKDATGIREAQLVQTEPGAIVVRVVPEGEPGPDLEAPVRAEAALRLAPGTRIAFEYVAALEKLPSGKTPFIVSRCREAAGDRARLAGPAAAADGGAADGAPPVR